jgi:hypothetical protein
LTSSVINIFSLQLSDTKSTIQYFSAKYAIAGLRTKWSSILSINKIFISITILETNIQRERPLHGDLSPVNEVFRVTTITSGNFFNTNCDVVDYSMAHILSYLVAGVHN